MNKLGARSAKIRIVRFGVDTRKFSPKQISAATFRMPGESGYPTIISTRPLAPLYDTESLIRCAPLVLRDVADAKFLIVGKGPEERRLKELARSLAVAHRVTFLGSIPNDKLPQYLTSSDVYVSTCLSDAGISASTAEAMACGLPVIVTDVAENRKWVEDGVNGFLVPTRDPRMLAEKILYLAKNRDIASRFGALCRHIIEERNDYCKEMTKMEDLYEQLATRRG
jgi:glycosyltransferase involved in cell wall biosynthesis